VKPPAGYDQGAEFTAVWNIPSGGWDAAVSYWQGEALHGRDLMHSADGLHWTALVPPPAAPIVNSDPFPWEHGGVADTTGARVVWQNWQDFRQGAGEEGISVATVSISRDGGRWTSADGFPGSRASVQSGLSGPAGPAHWLLAGADWSSTKGGSVPTIWRSTDGITWTALRLPETTGSTIGSPQSLVLTPNGYVAVGASSDGDHATWISADGVGWSVLPRSAKVGSDFGPAFVAYGPNGVIGVGVSPGGNSSSVWQLR
jgi:hypothetical protein